MSVLKNEWFVRKLAYAVAAVVGLVLFGAGVLNTDQADGLAQSIQELVPGVLTALVGGVAASKTHSGSDSTATMRDVVEAGKAAQLTNIVEDADTYGRHADPVVVASESSAPPAVESTADYARLVRGE